MFGLTNEDTITIIVFGFCLIAFFYSLTKYGYMVWFKPIEFMKLDEEKKKKSPRWLRFFMLLTTPLYDLWMMRIAYLGACIMILIVLIIVIVQVK